MTNSPSFLGQEAVSDSWNHGWLILHQLLQHIYGAIYRCQHYWWNFCENIKNNILYLLY